MTPRKNGTGESKWLGEAPARATDGDLWIGRHAVDDDVLVLDPSETDPTAAVLTLYSLREHRVRRFPRALVVERIHMLTDEDARNRAAREYAERAALRDAHLEVQVAEQAERLDRMREGIIAGHQRHLEGLGLEYQGVVPSADVRPTRASKCHACGISLDDFVGVACAACSAVLCSCAACACGKPGRTRPARSAAAE
jgi:hypothetical protein